MLIVDYYNRYNITSPIIKHQLGVAATARMLERVYRGPQINWTMIHYGALVHDSANNVREPICIPESSFIDSDGMSQKRSRAAQQMRSRYGSDDFTANQALFNEAGLHPKIARLLADKDKPTEGFPQSPEAKMLELADLLYGHDGPLPFDERVRELQTRHNLGPSFAKYCQRILYDILPHLEKEKLPLITPVYIAAERTSLLRYDLPMRSGNKETLFSLSKRERL